MSKRLLIAGLAALCALAVSAAAASGASAAATAYTVGSPTAIPVGESTGLALDTLGSQVLTTKQFGAKFVLTGNGAIDCVGCMGENHTGETGVASTMDVTGTGGRLLYTGVVTNIPGCTPEESGQGAGTVTTEPLKVTASEAEHTEGEKVVPGKANLSPVTGTTFAVIHLMSAPGETCAVAGAYTVEETGAGVTASVSGDVLSVNSTTELTVNGEKATLKGEATITAGTTGGEYHPVELKAS